MRPQGSIMVRQRTVGRIVWYWYRLGATGGLPARADTGSKLPVAPVKQTIPVPIVSVIVFCAAALLAIQPAAAQFSADKIALRSQLDLTALGATSGNDCWGYTSPTGREYALMGVRNKLAVVEITDPVNPVIVGTVSHSDSLWGDVKTFGNFAYVVNETGGGLDVIDLQNVDSGIVTLVQRVTVSGLSTSHNVVIDTDSGFLYLCLPNINAARLVAFDLADPANPVLAGMMSAANGGSGLHDAQIVTFTTGPNAGKQICFGASEGRGVDIIDVTDKSNMFRISRTPYPNLAYCHQVWTEDLQHLYVNDELDSIPRTIVFDITDLTSPVVAAEFASSLASIDHNLYVKDGFIFEADYHSGLRVFNANCDPLNPPLAGWLDTFPADDADGFDGAWSCYPFFPSGTVIVSDFDRGLFVLDPSAALAAGALAFAYPTGRPALVDPTGGIQVRVEVSGDCGFLAQPATGLLHVDVGAGFVAIPMTEVTPNVYDAVFPVSTCTSSVSYYFSAETTTGSLVTDPPDAPATTFSAVSAFGQNVIIQDTFEIDLGWTTAVLGATAGPWQRGVPIDDPNWPYDPAADSDGSGQCWLTENLNNPAYVDPSNTDVDGGAVQLISPTLDMTQPDLLIAYDYFLRLTDSNLGIDRMLVEISSNGGLGPWIEIARHDTDGGLSWRHHEITGADLDAAGVVRTATMVMRFTVNDDDPQSIVEAGLDAFNVSSLICVPCPPADGDMNGLDGTNGVDIQLFINAMLGAPTPDDICSADFSGNGTLGAEDVNGMVQALLSP